MKVAAVTLDLDRPVEVDGSGPYGGKGRFLAVQVTGYLVGCKVVSFVWHGDRVYKNGNTVRAAEFWSSDKALAAERLTVRRVAATAAQRCETGAR